MDGTVRFAVAGGGALVGRVGVAAVTVFRHPERVDVIVVDGGERAHAGMYASEAGFKKHLRNMIAEGHDGSSEERRRRWSADAATLARSPWSIAGIDC